MWAEKNLPNRRTGFCKGREAGRGVSDLEDHKQCGVGGQGGGAGRENHNGSTSSEDLDLKCSR